MFDDEPLLISQSSMNTVDENIGIIGNNNEFCETPLKLHLMKAALPKNNQEGIPFMQSSLCLKTKVQSSNFNSALFTSEYGIDFPITYGYSQ